MAKPVRKAIPMGLWLTVLIVTGCATLGPGIEEQVERHPETIGGGGTGLFAGVLFGSVFAGAAAGVAWGLLGTVGGGGFGHAFEFQAEQVRIERVEVQPAAAKPGGTVNLMVEYTVFTPDPNQEIVVFERREISVKGRPVGEQVLLVRRRAGIWTSTFPLTLPADAEAGPYRVVTTVEGRGSRDREVTTFLVQKEGG